MDQMTFWEGPFNLSALQNDPKSCQDPRNNTVFTHQVLYSLHEVQ